MIGFFALLLHRTASGIASGFIGFRLAFQHAALNCIRLRFCTFAVSHIWVLQNALVFLRLRLFAKLHIARLLALQHIVQTFAEHAKRTMTSGTLTMLVAISGKKAVASGTLTMFDSRVIPCSISALADLLRFWGGEIDQEGDSSSIFKQLSLTCYDSGGARSQEGDSSSILILSAELSRRVSRPNSGH